MTLNRRRRWVQQGIGLAGLTGLLLLVALLRTQPWLQRGLALFLVWQSFWWLVRLCLIVGLWRREPELDTSDKLWLGLAAPLPVLAAVWGGRGRLSAWMRSGEEA